MVETMVVEVVVCICVKKKDMKNEDGVRRKSFQLTGCKGVWKE